VRRLFSISFLLTVFLFSSLFSQDVQEIEWIPPDPVVGDDVTVAIHGITRNSSWRNQDLQGQIDGNNLLFTFTSLSEGIGGMVVMPFTLRHNWGELEEGEYNLFVTQSIGYVNENGDIDWVNNGFYQSRITVSEAELTEFIIALEEGWNMSSSPIAPEDDDIRAIFSEMVDRGSLILAKNGNGRFYAPEADFNNIPGWDPHQGYLIKVTEGEELLITGEILPEDDNLELTAGWSMIAYLPEAAISAPVAFENIADNLILAKDGDGRFYSPEHNFSNMGELLRGNGYLVKVEEAGGLIWNQR